MKYPPFLLGAICFILSCSQAPYPAPLSPEEALESFQLVEGYKIELFAAEPHVYDPVSMIFDEKGDVYVVEMPDYPYKPEAGRAKGRIRRLVDSNGDGRIDQSTVFADQLSEATSILPWKGGLLVTSAPHIYYLKDNDGDYRADQKETLFSGFFENNSEAQITNLRFSVDNWIYAGNFGQPGEVKFSRKPDAPALSMRGGDFRFRLDRGLFELATGPTQFGQTIDDWGRRFMTQNTIHLRHAVIPRRYLERHSYLPSMNAVHNISDHDLLMFQLTPPPYWRAERTRRRQKSYDEQNLDREEYAEDHFTGCSGSTIYDGDAMPELYGHIFTGDVAGNLIHRDILQAVEGGPTFVAQRAETEQEREFLASTDSWFRPANFTVGPDGYLYVIDMYRQHIETPVSIPEDLKSDMDFYNGMDRGRIYRIMPHEAKSQRQSFPNLSDKNSREYVELLTHPNRWQRLQAQRLLLERQDVSIESELLKLFRENEDPRTRLHALYVLEGLNLLQVDLIKQALNDLHPGVREHGLILAEKFPECLPFLLEKINDDDARVAFQACLSLGEFSGEQVVSALAEVVEKQSADHWFQKAVLSSKTGSSPALFEKLIHQNYFSVPIAAHKTAFLESFAFTIGARNRAEDIKRLLDMLDNSAIASEKAWRRSTIKGLINGLKKAEANPGEDALLQELLQSIEQEANEETKEIIQDIKR